MTYSTHLDYNGNIYHCNHRYVFDRLWNYHRYDHHRHVGVCLKGSDGKRLRNFGFSSTIYRVSHHVSDLVGSYS